MTTKTTPDYWDCECLKDYIHAKAHLQQCPHCGTRMEEQPDSIEAEVLRKQIQQTCNQVSLVHGVDLDQMFLCVRCPTLEMSLMRSYPMNFISEDTSYRWNDQLRIPIGPPQTAVNYSSLDGDDDYEDELEASAWWLEQNTNQLVMKIQEAFGQWETFYDWNQELYEFPISGPQTFMFGPKGGAERLS